MKTMLIASLVMASFVANAETGAGYDLLVEGGKSYATLEHCGGTATLSHVVSAGKVVPMITVANVKNCSIIKNSGVKIGHIPGGEGDKSYTLDEQPGLNLYTISIESGSGKTKDIIQVQSYGQLPAPVQKMTKIQIGLFSSLLGGEVKTELDSCGGALTASVNGNGQLVLKFKDLESCSKFDILKSNGDATDYPVKSMQVNSGGTFSSSFTIPKQFTLWGDNTVRVVVRSNSGKTDDVVQIKFGSY